MTSASFFNHLDPVFRQSFAGLELPDGVTPFAAAVTVGVLGAVIAFAAIAFFARPKREVVRIPPYRTGLAAAPLPAEPGLSYRVFAPPKSSYPPPPPVTPSSIPPVLSHEKLSEMGIPVGPFGQPTRMEIPPPPKMPSDLAATTFDVPLKFDEILAAERAEAAAAAATEPRRSTVRPMAVIGGGSLKIKSTPPPAMPATTPPSGSGVRSVHVGELDFEDAAKTEISEPVFEERPAPLARGERPKIRKIAI